MDKIDKLTPVIVLITATLINHCCKEKKELSISEFLIILSPSVPTVVPIFINIITDFCTNSYEYLKTLEYLKFIFLIFDFLKLKKCEKIMTKRNEKKLEKNDDNHNGFDVIKVSADLLFTQLFVSYIENNTNTCSYEISKDGKQFKLLKDRSVTEKEIWKNIKINFGKIEISLDNLEIMFKKSYGKIVLSNFSHSTSFEEKTNVDNSKITRLTDIITHQQLKSYINRYHDLTKTKYETFEKKQKDAFFKYLKEQGYFEYAMIENLHEIFPNVDKLLFLADFYILATVCSQTQNSLMSVLKSCHQKTGKIFLFDVEFPIKKIYSYSIFTSESNKEYTLYYSVTLNNGMHFISPPNDAVIEAQDFLNKVSLTASVLELQKKTSKEENTLIFYAKLNNENLGKEKLKENNFKTVSMEFNNFIEKIKNFDVVQSNGNKIKIFNTTIERIDKKPEDKKYGYGPGSYNCHKNIEKEKDKDKEEDNNIEKNTNDENKENKNTEHSDSDSDSDSDVSKNTEKTKSKKDKKYKGKKYNNFKRSYPAYSHYDHDYDYYNIHELYNNKNKKEPEKEAVVAIKEINEKYKSIETLYLRESDYRRLVNILSRFKNSSHLYDKYGLPNKLGVLLYGEPGTGKSTTIQVIGSYLQKNIYYVNLSTVETNNELQMIFDEINLSMNGGIIVFEDIDAMSSVVYNRNISTVSEGDKLTLEYFLNLLQGSLTRDGTIFIATTNHLEKLDPAFYRVGRFDIKIDMKKCDQFQIKTIYEKFVGKSINYDVLKKIPSDKYTPAEIIFHLVNHIDSEDSDEIIMKDFIE